MTKDKLDTQRKVVQNERRQRSEDEPYGKVELRLPELLYPDAHPYHHPVIGSHEDLEAASVDDVKEFFATWYDPANASLVVAGDFDAKATLPKIRALFEGIPSRGAPKDPGAPGFDPEVSSLKTVARETIEDNVELAKVVIAWQSPKRFGAGDAELDLLGTVLASGKASRLYGSLVYTKKLAQDVDVRQESGTLGSRFVVDVTARPGVPLEKIEAAVDQELDMLRKADVKDEELQRAKNGVEAAFVHKLETVRERASLLNLYEADLGDPGFVGKDLARYAKVDAKSIRDAVTRWLDPKTRVILRVVPKKEGADTATKNGKGAAK
ncbi:MAG: pitrilysin family protein [Polyangiaceae bacterium]